MPESPIEQADAVVAVAACALGPSPSGVANVAPADTSAQTRCFLMDPPAALLGAPCESYRVHALLQPPCLRPLNMQRRDAGLSVTAKRSTGTALRDRRASCTGRPMRRHSGACDR